MKSLFNLRTIVFAFTVIVFAGCSGITEATLPDADSNTINSTNTEVLHQEAPGFVDSIEHEAPTVLPTPDKYKDRE